MESGILDVAKFIKLGNQSENVVGKFDIKQTIYFLNV